MDSITHHILASVFTHWVLVPWMWDENIHPIMSNSLIVRVERYGFILDNKKVYGFIWIWNLFGHRRGIRSQVVGSDELDLKKSLKFGNLIKILLSWFCNLLFKCFFNDFQGSSDSTSVGRGWREDETTTEFNVLKKCQADQRGRPKNENIRRRIYQRCSFWDGKSSQSMVIQLKWRLEL